jgi:hypothetical protein
MIITKRHLGLRSARIILDDALLKEAVSSSLYSYISAISYHKYALGITVRIKHKKTISVAIDRDIDEIFGEFRRDTRNEIRHTFSDPLFTVVSDDKNYKEIFGLYSSFEKAQGRSPYGKGIFDGSKAFSVYYDGVLVSCIICYDARPILRSRANFSRRLDVVGDKIMCRVISRATRRVMYEIYKYGSKNAYTSFDHGSVNLTDPAKKGIADFKQSFGGTIIDEYTYTYESVIARILGSIYKKIL